MRGVRGGEDPPIAVMPNSRQGQDDSTKSNEGNLSPRSGGILPVSGSTIAWIGLFLMAGLFAIFYQLQKDLDGLESQLIHEAGGQRMKVMGEEMAKLQGRLQGLMADSVEIRLKALERNLASGQITPELMQQFDVLKNDIRSLEDYADGPHVRDLGEALPEHPRYRETPEAASKVLTKAEMFQEISRLRVLLYLCLTGLVATGGVLLGRYWLMVGRPPPRLPAQTAAKPPLLTRRR